jgi:acyl-CoA thioesterase I
MFTIASGAGWPRQSAVRRGDVLPVGLVAAALLLVGAGDVAARGTAIGAAPGCSAAPALAGIGAVLGRAAAQIRRGRRLTIVALGSSSTSGVGASAPWRSYPSRLEADLHRLLPTVAVRVFNRGIGGEEVPQMLARLDRDVLPEHPDLVIWQLGTNAVLDHDDPQQEAPLIARGIARLERHDADVVLMDLQYAPRVVASPSYKAMERIIAATARRAHVGLFRRFQIMQAWQRQGSGEPPHMIGRDGVHMNDRGYGCVAADLAAALVAGWHAAPQAPSGEVASGAP